MDIGGNSLPSGADGVKRKVSHFYDPEVGNYYYGQGHPMKPHQIRMTHALLAHYVIVKIRKNSCCFSKKTMSPKITKRNSERIAACFTCPLCNKLFKDPTTICECVHTFCQKCITEKLIEERLHNCPLCSAELGGAPLDKLRADHSLEYMMPRVFRKKPTPSLKATQPSKKKKSKSRRKNPSPQKLTAARAYSRKRSKNPAQPEPSTNLIEDSHKGSKSLGKNLTSSESTIPIEDTNPGETLRDRRQVNVVILQFVYCFRDIDNIKHIRHLQ